MKLYYDHSAGSLSIAFKEGKVEETREIAPEVNLDIDKNGVPLYLEIIGASEKLGEDKIGELLVQNWNYDLQKAVAEKVMPTFNLQVQPCG